CHTRVDNLDNISPAPPLRRNTLSKVGSGTGNVSYFDLGVSFLKYPRIDNSSITANRDHDLSFLLSCAYRLIPLGLPRCFRIGGKNGSARTNDVANQKEHANDKLHRVNFPLRNISHHAAHEGHEGFGNQSSISLLLHRPVDFLR